MFLRLPFLLIPSVLLAQTPPAPFPPVPAASSSAPDAPSGPPAPPEVDQALRARATEFLQFNLEGNFRKAYDLVSEESKDYYFSLAKPKYLSFKINAVEYSENFTKAVVRVVVRRSASFQSQSFEFDLPMQDNWKLEGGKWLWFHLEQKSVATPLGEFPVTSSGVVAPVAPPKDLSPAGVKKLATELKVAEETKPDRDRVIFKLGSPGTEEVSFHNGASGPVNVLISAIGPQGLFEVTPREASIAAGEDLKVTIAYKPPADPGKDAAFRLRFSVEPFNMRYIIPIAVVSEPDKFAHQFGPKAAKPATGKDAPAAAPNGGSAADKKK